MSEDENMIKEIHGQGTAPIYFMYVEGEKDIEYVDWLKEEEEKVVGNSLDDVITFLQNEYRILDDDIELSKYVGHINGIKFRFIDHPEIRGVIYIIFLRDGGRELYPCYIFRTMIEYRLTPIDSITKYKKFCWELEKVVDDLGLKMNVQAIPLRLYPHSELVVYMKGEKFGIDEIKSFINKIKNLGGKYPICYPAFDVRIAKDVIEYLI